MADTEKLTKVKNVGRKLAEGVSILIGVGLVNFGVIKLVELAAGQTVLTTNEALIVSAVVGAAFGMLPFAKSDN